MTGGDAVADDGEDVEAEGGWEFLGVESNLVVSTLEVCDAVTRAF